MSALITRGEQKVTASERRAHLHTYVHLPTYPPTYLPTHLTTYLPTHTPNSKQFDFIRARFPDPSFVIPPRLRDLARQP